MAVIEINQESQIAPIAHGQKHVQFLQSWHWKTFQESIGRRTFLLGVEEFGHIIGYALFIQHKLPLKSYLYCPRGPLFMKDITYEKQATATREILHYLKKRSQELGVIFLRIEPPETITKKEVIEEIWWSSKLIWKRVRFVQPSDTLLLNLNQTTDRLVENMHHKTRYNIKLAKRKGVTTRVLVENEYEIFWELLQQTARRQHIKTHNKSYYQVLSRIQEPPDCFSKIFLAEYQGVAMAAIMVMFYQNTAIYLHGGTNELHRNVMAPHLLQWCSIREAQRLSMRYYDFYGIAPHDADVSHPLTGVGRFKRGFGGIEVNYVGTYELVFHAKWYALYQLAKAGRQRCT